MSASDYDARNAEEPDFLKVLLGGPVWDAEMLDAVEDRSGELPREVDV